MQTKGTSHADFCTAKDVKNDFGCLNFSQLSWTY